MLISRRLRTFGFAFYFDRLDTGCHDGNLSAKLKVIDEYVLATSADGTLDLARVSTQCLEPATV